MLGTTANIENSIELLEGRRHLSASLYKVTNLVSDGFVPAAHVDANLKNPWGAIVSDGLRVVNAGTGTSTHYDGRGRPNHNTIAVPAGDGLGGNLPHGIPTTLIANPTHEFVIKNGRNAQPATYLMANIDGGIVGYNANVKSSGVIAADSSDEGNVYTGGTIAQDGGKNYLYLADVHGHRIEVYDGKFHDADRRGDFTDPHLPANYSPFNIAQYDGKLFVTYADFPPGAPKQVTGKGKGLIDVFNTDGTFVKRFATGGNLNAPWGMTWAPHAFGSLVHTDDLLVGNFGSGHVEVFSQGGTFKGTLMKAGPDDDRPVAPVAPKTHAASPAVTSPVEAYGMWTIAFGNGKGGTSKDALYFTAGINDEQDGLIGSVTLA